MVPRLTFIWLALLCSWLRSLNFCCCLWSFKLCSWLYSLNLCCWLWSLKLWCPLWDSNLWSWLWNLKLWSSIALRFWQNARWIKQSFWLFNGKKFLTILYTKARNTSLLDAHGWFKSQLTIVNVSDKLACSVMTTHNSKRIAQVSTLVVSIVEHGQHVREWDRCSCPLDCFPVSTQGGGGDGIERACLSHRRNQHGVGGRRGIRK